MKKNVIILTVLILTGLILAWPISAFFMKMEKQPLEQQLAALDKIAQEALDDTKNGNLEDAKRKVNKLAELFPNQTMPSSIRIESLHAVTQSILTAKNLLATTKQDEIRLLWHMTQVRVAIDALHHQHQPLWKAYYTSYSKQMQQLMNAIVERNVTAFRAQLEENYQLYLAIRPAMSIHLNDKQMEQIATSYSLLMKEIRSDSVEWQEIREAVRELNGQMQEAFIGQDQTTIVNWMGTESPFMLITTVTAVVVLTLSYVAWKKYNASQRLL